MRNTGVPTSIVTRSSRTAEQTARNSSGLATVTIVIALVRGSQQPVLSPKTWNSGRLPRMVSPSPYWTTSCMPAMLADRLRWLSGTTFGSASLPLVNRMTIGSSESHGWTEAMTRPAGSSDRSRPRTLATRPMSAARSSMKTMPATSGHLSFASSARDVMMVRKPRRRCAIRQFCSAPVE